MRKSTSRIFQQSSSYAELFGIDGETVEFEWNIFPRLTSLEMLQKVQEDLRSRRLEPEDFQDRVIFMSMFNDIDRTMRGNSEKCISNSEQIKNYAGRFPQDHWTFLAMIRRNWSPNIQRYQCVESWYSEMEAKPRHHTLQCGLVEHRTLVSNHPLCKSAQYLRSSVRLVGRIRSRTDRNRGLRKVRDESANVEGSETTRSEFSCPNSKG